MAYCTITDVNRYVPQAPYTSTTVPSQAQVEQFITDTANQLELTLGNLGYVVPVTEDSQALAELRKVNAWGALGIAQQVRLTAVAPDQALGLSVWTKMFTNWLKCLFDPNDPYELSGAIRTGLAVVKPVGEMQSDTSLLPSTEYSYLTNPPFTMDMKL